MLSAGPLSVASSRPTEGPFAQTKAEARKATTETLENWREIAAMITANRSSGDKEALLSLGDSLVSVGWLCAGHAW